MVGAAIEMHTEKVELDALGSLSIENITITGFLLRLSKQQHILWLVTVKKHVSFLKFEVFRA